MKIWDDVKLRLGEGCEGCEVETSVRVEKDVAPYEIETQ